MKQIVTRAVWAGALALGALLGVYFGLITLVSGWSFALEQFGDFWYYIVALAAGFGVQVGLFVYLRGLVSGAHGNAKVMAVSGTASTAAMVSCCTHYLANLLPIIGAAGLVSLVGQYQVELFWVGLVFNAGGIVYIGRQVVAAAKEHARCVVPA